MVIASLALRFLVELLGVGALGYWGFVAGPDALPRVVTGIGAPLLLIVVWALVVAPSADNRLAPRVREVVGTVLLVGAAAALASAGQPVPAVVLATLVIVNQLLLIGLGGEVTDVVGRLAGPRN